MTFDIRQLDKLEDFDEEALDAYQDALLERFLDSSEGQARLAEDPDMGFWAAQFMYYGYGYLGYTLPQTTDAVADEIVTEMFPRKISILSPDEADDTIPELIAFWQFLKREYKLRHADAVLRQLRNIAPDFKDVMNDSSRFGMAKSFFTMGQTAGFDLTSEQGMDEFVELYNAGIAESLPDEGGFPGLLPGMPIPFPGMPNPSKPKKASTKKKKSRKAAKASRKKNRRKRK